MSSQVIPTSWGEYAPKIRDFVSMTSGFLPFWEWLLILSAILLSVSLVSNLCREGSGATGWASIQSHSLLIAAWITMSAVAFYAPALVTTLPPHDPVQPAPPLEARLVLSAATSISDSAPNIPSSHQPDFQQAQQAEPAKPEPQTPKLEHIDSITDTSEYNKEYTKKTARYLLNLRKNKTSIQAKKLLEPYNNTLFVFKGKIQNVNELYAAMAVLITLEDKNTVYCMYPKSMMAYLSRFDVGDAISGVGTLNDELGLPAVVLYGCHPK